MIIKDVKKTPDANVAISVSRAVAQSVESMSTLVIEERTMTDTLRIVADISRYICSQVTTTVAELGAAPSNAARSVNYGLANTVSELENGLRVGSWEGFTITTAEGINRSLESSQELHDAETRESVVAKALSDTNTVRGYITSIIHE